jgi:DICT domain-containing protein
MAAVMAYAERSGAVLLAEGIETDDHLERAVSLGATWGQGYRFGYPGDLVAPDDSITSSSMAAPLVAPGRAVSLSPYDATIGAGLRPRVARKHVLLQISHHLEAQALADPSEPLLLAAFQDAEHFTPDTARRYRQLADRLTLCAALGVGMDAEPALGVRGAALNPGDPLTGEWSVVVLGPHYSGALLARDLGDHGGAEADRRFSYVVTHDRSIVEVAAESLLRRVLPR